MALGLAERSQPGPDMRSLGGRAEFHTPLKPPHFHIVENQPLGEIITFPPTEKTKPEERKETGISPSKEAAWLLGYLSSGGSINHNRDIETQGFDQNLLTKFSDNIDLLFGIKPKIKTSNSGYSTSRVSSKTAAEALGDLRRTEWVKTITQKFSWIFDKNHPDFKNEIGWKFIEAFLETSSNIDNGKNKQITINTIYQDSALFIINLCKSLGITSAQLTRARNPPEGIRGVRIYKIENFRRIADNTSLSPQKLQDRLTELSHYQSQKENNEPISDEDAIKEWIRITKEQGRNPGFTALHKLRSEGKTLFSPTVYINRFGGSFAKARETLERISLERQQAHEKALLLKQGLFAQEYERYRQTIYGFALGRLRDRATAEDICSETFADAWSSFKDLPENHIKNMEAWFYKCTKNQIDSYLRRQKLERKTSAQEINSYGDIFVDSDLTPEQAAIDIQSVNDLLSRLTYIRREVVILRLQGYSFAEIEQRTGIKEATLKTRFVKAKNDLMRIYQFGEDKNGILFEKQKAS